MISILKGIVAERKKKTIVVMLGGLGFEVFVSDSLEIKEGEEISLHTYLHVREDALVLFGFPLPSERNFYILLLSVSGVGPKLAMETMNHSVNEIKGAILNNDDVLLSQVKGLGKKTAKKIILELSGKVEMENIENMETSLFSKSDEVVQALLNLGFKRKEILARLKDLPQDIKKSEDAITWFLRKG